MVTLARRCATVALFSLSCQPNTEGGAFLVESPRVLAIRSEPAEAAPNKPVTYTALYAGPEPTLDSTSLDWALCLARKPIAVAGSISLDCLQPEADATVLTPLGTGEMATGILPKDGCRVFGPSPPAPKPGEPTARPADPDSSGGYYQPLRVRAPLSDTEYSVGFTRISCGVDNATQDQSVDYGKRYRGNQNPDLDGVVADPEGDARPLSESADDPTILPAGAKLVLRASWAQCPVEANCGDGVCTPSDDRDMCPADCSPLKGCTGAESYVYLDLIQHKMVEHREAMRASWYATAGSFEHDRSGRSSDDAAQSFSDNNWTAPTKSGDVKLWVVLRDDRGGVGYKSFYARIE